MKPPPPLRFFEARRDKTLSSSDPTLPHYKPPEDPFPRQDLKPAHLPTSKGEGLDPGDTHTTTAAPPFSSAPLPLPAGGRGRSGARGWEGGGARAAAIGPNARALARARLWANPQRARASPQGGRRSCSYFTASPRGMAGGESGSEGSDEEELPTLASILQPPSGGLSRQRPSSPRPEPGVVVVESSEEEDEVVEVPLSERIKRRGEAAFNPPQLDAGDAAGRAGFSTNCDLVPGSQALMSPGDVSCGDQNGMCGSERLSLCPPDAADQPSRPLVSEASPEISPSPKNPKYSQKEREAICQAAWQRRKERETRRRQQEQEKERKRALAKMLKAQRPGECQKYITVVLDPGTCSRSLHLLYVDSQLLLWRPDPCADFSSLTGGRWWADPQCFAGCKLFLCC